MIVTVTGEVQKRCPYRNERDHGKAVLTFLVTDEDAPEFHNLAGLLKHGAEVALSHEQYTRQLHQTWAEQGCVAVRTTWHTAGLEVTVDVPGDQHHARD